MLSAPPSSTVQVGVTTTSAVSHAVVADGRVRSESTSEIVSGNTISFVVSSERDTGLGNNGKGGYESNFSEHNRKNLNYYKLNGIIMFD